MPASVLVRTTDVKLTPRQRAREAAHFEKVRRAENQYGVALRRIARHVGELVRQMTSGVSQGELTTATAELESVMRRYAEILRPWARRASARMIAEVARRDERAWFASAEKIGAELRDQVRAASLGEAVRRLQAEQVELITSLPLEAATRVQALSREFVTGGRRFAELSDMIAVSGSVARSRADVIARTEVGKAAAVITRARAAAVGSEGYIWRTARDPFVRREHKHLEGTFHRWDDPPVAEAGGQRHHPGEFPNCRCYAEPVIPDTEE
jgi:SPP1 gp7 family putative phage head morphogenesis protein